MRTDLKSVPKSVPKVGGASMSGKGVAPVVVRPLQDRVIVKRVAEDETSKGGIIIPDNAKEKPQEGQVVAVGPGRRNDNGTIVALGVEKGDRVLFAKFAGRDVEIHGEEHLILQESDILGVIEK